MITFDEIVGEGDWKAATAGLNIPLTQTFTYGEIQKHAGRGVRRFKISSGSNLIGAVTLIAYPLFGNLKYWYSPYGPVLTHVSEESVRGVHDALKSFVQKEGGVFVRVDFSSGSVCNDDVFKKYFIPSSLSSYAGAYFQPRAEWYTDISKSPEEILGAMHSKTRYSVKYAERKGVVTQISKSDLSSRIPDFLRLMKLTASRNGFALHNDTYYESYFKEVEKTGNGFVIEARFNEHLLASHFVFVVGDVAHYVFGATSDEYKDLCAPYLAHFNAMLEAKNMGAKYYNFGAVSSDGLDTKWQGLTTFKQKFGGRTIQHAHFYDLVSSPFWYYVYIVRKLLKRYL